MRGAVRGRRADAVPSTVPPWLCRKLGWSWTVLICFWSPGTSLTPSQPFVVMAGATLFLFTGQGLNYTHLYVPWYTTLLFLQVMKQRRAQAHLIQIHRVMNTYKQTKLTSKPDHIQSQLPLERAAVCLLLPIGKGWENKYQVPDVVYIV